MWLQALSLDDFRSYSHVECEFSPGVSVLIGSNGQGKTNLVEAIGYLATLGSHRVSTDAPLIKDGAPHAVVRARVIADPPGESDNERAVTLDLQITQGSSNKARINRSATTRARDILGIIKVVLFAPEDLSLVKGDPSDRRAFLDSVIVQLTPRLAGVRADYDRVIKQRNALLKSARGSNDENFRSTLDVWNEQLITYGTEIIEARARLVDQLRAPVQESYRLVAGEENSNNELTIRYLPKGMEDFTESGPFTATREDIAERLRTLLFERFKDESVRGVTLVGPHRDDLSVTLGAHPVKGYASHGESWSAALALRLASAEVLRSDGMDPIIILDDVFAELDVHRREHLAARVNTYPQVFITAAVAHDVPSALTGDTFTVSGGTITREVSA